MLKHEEKYCRMKKLHENLQIPVSTLWYFHKQGKFRSYKVSAKVTLFKIDEVKQALGLI